jgi:NADH:ubiquinone oxidoreductase subunit F (NADH-binding)/NAD-dependent dihydropyrimidine dehydrogenase PreA subunit
MEGLLDIRCCDKCWHRRERFCPESLECATTGPLCHEGRECGEIRSRAISSLRRESPMRPVIFVGTGTCGLGAGAGKTLEAIGRWRESTGRDAELIEVGCVGACYLEPIVDVLIPGRPRLSFSSVSADRVGTLLDGAFSGSPSKDDAIGQYMSQGLVPWEGVQDIAEHPFFSRQKRWVLANCGIIDPSSIDEYIANGGYRAYSMALRTRTPAEVCDIVERSGLRGRGGGGFPTGRKWKLALAQSSDTKYMICNADEGDPGAFMDRAVIEGDPHRLIEGLAIASYAIGASHAYVYIRAEYPLAIRRLREAMDAAREHGLIGRNILDSGIDLDIVVKMGAGAFVCGEETALMHSIEGRRGMPRPRPPYPAVSGLFGRPTAINNVETLANVPDIVRNGAEWFSSLGTAGSKGTKVFALSGKVLRTGLVEVAMGTTLNEIINEIGGGTPDGKAFKAVQIGGPSGGCIPAGHLDIQIDYESLKSFGAIMGSGGLVVMDEDNCMVDVARFFMDFIQRESCGKCIPCREGTKRMLEILNAITTGRREEKGSQALERFQGVMQLEQLGEVIRSTSLCGLGQTAPNPVLSTLRWFRDEYEAHVFDRKCKAGVCQSLLLYSIDPEKCRGCTLCAKKCPAGAILGTPKAPHHIVPERCVGCGTCREACPFAAITVE